MQQSPESLEPFFLYLDRLAKLRIAKMCSVGLYLESRFLIDSEEAQEILDAWLWTTGDEGS